MVRAVHWRGFVVAAAVSSASLSCSSSSTPAAGVDGGHNSSGSSGNNSTHTTSSKTTKPEHTTSSHHTTGSNSKMKDSGVEDAPKGMTDAGGASCNFDAGAPDKGLYMRLGGHAGIRAAVDLVVKAETSNADLASYFFYQTTGAAPADGHPTTDQVEECFANLIGSATGGTEKYPGPLANGPGYDGGVYVCRDIKEAHAALQIDQATFNEFIAIAGMTLTSAGVCPQDLNTLAGALLGFQSAVVQNPKTADAAEPFPGSVDAALHISYDGGKLP